MSSWAEVIGDPVSHSLSPSIHGFWLRKLGVSGRYDATQVHASALAGFIGGRREDPRWCGCNVTAPHKERVPALVDRVDQAATAVGAVNCVYRQEGLLGTNTDVEGVAEALRDVPVRGEKIAVIGGGGGARAALYWLRQQDAGEVVLVVRRTVQAVALGSAAVPFNNAAAAFSGATLIINATPLGLRGGDEMPPPILEAVRVAKAAAAFDMVYRPLETAFLAAARESGAHSIDGLAMLIGQARRAFRLFYGEDPPGGADDELRRLLAAAP